MEGVAAKVAKSKAEASKTLAQVEVVQSKSQLNLAQVVVLGHSMGLEQQAANKPEPAEAPEVPDQETPDMANERMINEAIAEAATRRQAGAPMQ